MRDLQLTCMGLWCMTRSPVTSHTKHERTAQLPVHVRGQTGEDCSAPLYMRGSRAQMLGTART